MIKASPRNVPNKIDAEEKSAEDGRIIRIIIIIIIIIIIAIIIIIIIRRKKLSKSNMSYKLRLGAIITRFDCAWMQTQKSPNDPHIRIRACGCKFHHYQPIPHFKILLDINFH